MGGRGASSGVSSGKRSAGSFKANGSSRFWGNYETTSRKYAKIEKQVFDDGTFILFTNNVKTFYSKGDEKIIMPVDNNKAIYLNMYSVMDVGVKDGNGSYIGEQTAVKINKKYFKTYTFKNNFDDMHFDKADTFESLKNVAKQQEKKRKNYQYGIF